jgi:hypothetical protein
VWGGKVRGIRIPLVSASPTVVNKLVHSAWVKVTGALCARRGLTIRSSVPLPRAAVLSCGVRQRPLDSSATRHYNR